MGTMVCDFCGGKLVAGAGGAVTCGSCGVEYSSERMREKASEMKEMDAVRGDDPADRSEYWMDLARKEKRADRNAKACEYFQKAIDADPDNWCAVYEKGKAAAMQSTPNHIRTDEMLQGIKNALEIIRRTRLPAEKEAEIRNQMAEEFFKINNAITDIMEEELIGWAGDETPDYSQEDQMWDMNTRYRTNVLNTETALRLISALKDKQSLDNMLRFKKQMCSDLRKACEPILFWEDDSQSEMSCLGLFAETKKSYLDKYWTLVEEIREAEPSFATDPLDYPDPFDPLPFDPRLHFAEEKAAYWQKEEEERRERREKSEQERRFREYWEQHAEEKKRLQAEKSSLEKQIEPLQADISRIPGDADREQLLEKIGMLSSEMKSLGIFKWKERKKLQERIDTLHEELKYVEDKMNAQKAVIEEKMAPFRKRIDAIEEELTKPR